MAIVCTKCKYILPKATIMSFVASAAAGPIFYFTKEMALLYLEFKIKQTRKGYDEQLSYFVENTAVGIAKQMKIDCPICSEFKDWITEPDEIDESEIIE